MTHPRISLRRLAPALFVLGCLTGPGSASAHDMAVIQFGATLDFFASPDFTAGGAPTSNLGGIVSDGAGALFLHGSLTDDTLGTAAWVRQAGTPTATRIGLWGPGFSPATSTIGGLTGGQLLYGASARTDGGTASWVASSSTGATTRVGLWDAAGSGFYTSASGAQTSTVSHATSTGYLAGSSTLYQAGTEAGQAVWLATAATGVTVRTGLHGTPEFTSASNNQSSTVSHLSDSGWAAGTSLRYNGGSDQLGQAAWIGDGVTTYRLGLSSGDAASGAGYTTTNGTAFSNITGLGATHVLGQSNRYLGDTHAGHSAWVANLGDGQTVRIGLWDETGSISNEFTSLNGVQMSGAIAATLVDGTTYVSGSSRRYMGLEERSSFATGYGGAAWIYDTATGETTRMGLTGDEFTKISGTTTTSSQIGAQNSSIVTITASGYILGKNTTYSATESSTGEALWVSQVDNLGAVTRVGLHDPAGTPDEELEFTPDHGAQRASLLIGLTESGHLAGTTNRQVYSDDWGVGTTAGRAAWVASAATGETHRVGFTQGTEYTSNVTPYGTQFSNLYTETGSSDLLNEKARVTGYSQRYKDQAGSNPGAPTRLLGHATWIANANTGATTRIGLWEGAAYNQQTGTLAGTQHSAITGIHSGTDYVWGYSQRYTAEATSNVSTNRTAWIYNVLTGDQVAFEFGASELSGLSFSIVNGMTSGGIAYGHYTIYLAGTDTSAGNRAFLWSDLFGTQTLDSVVGNDLLASGGWDYLSTITSAEDNGSGLLTLVGEGVLLAGGTQTFSLTIDLAPIPEPASAAVLLAGAALSITCFVRRRRRR